MVLSELRGCSGGAPARPYRAAAEPREKEDHMKNKIRVFSSDKNTLVF